MLRQMRDQGLQARLIGGDALVLEDYWSITGSGGEGTLFSFAPDMRENAGRGRSRQTLSCNCNRALWLYSLYLRRDPGLGVSGRAPALG